MSINTILTQLGQNKVTLDINTNEFIELYEYIKDVSMFNKLFNIADEYEKLGKNEDINLRICFDNIVMPQSEIKPSEVGSCSKKKDSIKEQIQFYIKENVPERIDKLLVKYLREIAVNIGINPNQTKPELRSEIKQKLI